MTTKDFYYDLPPELIAQTPLTDRTASRLLVVNKKTGKLAHKHFYDIVDYLNPGDCLVMNNTRVIPARLYGSKEKFEYDGIWEELLDKLGEMPLPPYIKEKLTDKERYQTVYSKIEGSAAAPTAGLHFTKELLEKIKAKGVKLAYLTLHVGLGTFRPVSAERIEDHIMHTEYYEISAETAEIINSCRKNGGRIIAVGTTSVRTLETVADDAGKVKAASGETNIFIYPGYKFKIVDCIITNFHLPESTLMMLVSAFAGKENIFNAYETAVKEKYRFFSFGDAMYLEGERNV